MGIDVQGLCCLSYAKKFGDFGRTITIGRQKISVSASKIRSFLGRPLPDDLTYCESLLAARFGASTIESVDFSDYEQATVIHDLNRPVPPDIETFDTVIDFGTIEHVFDVSMALANMRTLCRVGGQILHVSPADNFCGHGFWQISPELFFSLYSEDNGFEHTEVFLARRERAGVWFRVARPPPGRRVPLRTHGKTVVICRTMLSRRVASPSVQQSDYVSEWADVDDALAPSWLYRRIQYKYFRRVSALNPHLTRLDLRQLLS